MKEKTMILKEQLIHSPPKQTKPRQYGRYFTKLLKFITDENTIFVPQSEVKKGRMVNGKWVFLLPADNLIDDEIVRIPERIVAKIGRIKRYWVLSHISKMGRLVYTSMVGDVLMLEED